MVNGIYDLTLLVSDGRERRIIAWFPTDAVRKDFYEKANRHGISVTEVKNEIWSASP